MKENKIELLNIIEQDMILLWANSNGIPDLLKEDEEFVNVITSAIMLEIGYWRQYMEIGEA
jgi:hypothetical protein|tara:strand:+ start:141 stop:323 length:183 start_codon:yes stop_codon:yes gene_type:complete